ncbi:Cystic fibrosis transmembrane conductance regulator (CFTR) (ATP-binding cassette sub-family C member 7) (Channel conductance-controlling ATPase) (cAMP-dependent chloride channel) [Durusdinium trenchii]|uniref:Cystic fibrosis transmembrane conductance regulator (CFTR) (ATP-binding cassette sub-family C member 7) (Channel conductance-controlling ATPase) (cAMP-dependent chloride channel) n=1 Tax=Durusdinium trenchii TaxID=1381693 RepID=A0ABP0HFB9_9DINO
MEITPAENGEKGLHPLEQGGCWTAISLRWISPLASKAAHGHLEARDVWAPPQRHSVEEAQRCFAAAWDSERRRRRRPSLARAMLAAFRGRFLWTAAVLMIFMGTQLCQPFLVRELVTFLQGEGGVYEGWILASLLLLCSLSSSILICEYFRAASMLGEVLAGMSILQLPLDESIDGLDLRGHHDRHCRSFSLGGGGRFGGQHPFAAVLRSTGRAHQSEVHGAQGREDEVTGFVTEVVQGIRIAKLYAWEEAIFRIPAPQRTENGELSPRPSPSPLD